jgi:hypothetical protein
MTSGQQRAIRELRRLQTVAGSTFELVQEPAINEGRLVTTVSIKIGVIENKPGGLDLREREEFVLYVPPGFPFERPWVRVEHTRFASFPHVIWSHGICLYQSSMEWNPSDGLFGFFDRLNMWLGRAAMDDMDPVDGPLEPPHHDTDFSQIPFVVRADAPCAAGESWVGLALMEKRPNCIDLVGWDDLSGEWPKQGHLAFAVILPKPLPMEFPSNGAQLFQEIEKAGMQRERILKNLALAALLAPEGQPLHFVLGLPMRRAKDGSKRIHVAVWTADAKIAGYLRSVFPANTDTDHIRELRAELSDDLMKVFEVSEIKWCQVFEDRAEIVVRRDNGTPIAWFAGKKILILGCGALGSWAAEIVARAMPREIHLVDNGLVKPGVLARQNFEQIDIGANKSNALASRLTAITHGCGIVPNAREAHSFIFEDKNRFCEFDLILDCTASSIFQQKLERDWASLSRHTPPFVSLVIDAQAKHCLCVVTPKDSNGGIWNAYLSFKKLLCMEGNRQELAKAFYSEKGFERLFQPEPGCSDPTFVGSTADVMDLTSSALNIAIKNQPVGAAGLGMALSTSLAGKSAQVVDVLELPQFCEIIAGNYRVRIATSIFPQAKGWVNQNNRRNGSDHETGGLLWGFWDDAIQVIWIFDLSGPPPDSQHNPALFVCGVKGTAEEHKRRKERTYGASSFVGHWHTHPDFPSRQSPIDISTMANLVSSAGHNQKRSVMLIFGRTRSVPTAGIYVYESDSVTEKAEHVLVGTSQITLERAVV